MQLSLKEARQIVLEAQLIASREPKNSLGIIKQLGYVQIDSISVIERAHHHILWTRLPSYQTDELNNLMLERQIFEYWSHAASYIPMENYRFYLPRMQKFFHTSHWGQRHYQEHKHLLKPILKEITANGPMAAKDFKSQKNQPGGWWNWKPAKIVLELLYWNGDLMVSHRENFQKVYDLKERVLPTTIDQSLPTATELAHYHILNSLKALGIASAKEISQYLLPTALNKVNSSIQELLAEEKLIACQIENISTPYFMLNQNLSLKTEVKPTVKLLSPFDNLVIQRQRLKELFHFDYRLECYVPQAKRVYGYFCLPILFQDTMIGLVDLKVERKTKQLIIQNIVLNDLKNELFLLSLTQVLKEFAQFNQCQSIDVSSVKPQKLKNLLQKSVIKDS